MITTHQVRNVLRTYSDQLRKRNTYFEDNPDSHQQPSDLVSISIDARRKQMLSRMSDNLISQISKRGQAPETEEEPSGGTGKAPLQIAGESI